MITIDTTPLIELFATVVSSVKSCAELNYNDYPTCIDVWQEIHLNDIKEKYNDLHFNKGQFEYKNASVTIGGICYNLKSVFDLACYCFK